MSPLVCAGVLHENSRALTNAQSPATPSNVMTAPPNVGPSGGSIESTRGGAMYVNRSGVVVAEIGVPAASTSLPTLIDARPGGPGGVVHVIVVDDTTCTSAQGAVPTNTVI